VNRVAVIGAGPAGLVVSRWLVAHGFEPVIFEQADELGGQWTAQPGLSGIWPTMRTNTSRVLTAFGDLEPEGDAVYPAAGSVLAYLRRYASTLDLTRRIRLATRVDRVRRGEQGWVIEHSGSEEPFARIVVASGRFHRPAIPPVRGLETFTGKAGVVPTYDFRDPGRYRGLRMLVAGGAISALEVATELVHNGAARVVVTQRRQRYVLPKFAAGVPSDHRVFTRYGSLAEQALPRDENDRQLKEIVVEAGGSPEQYGAPAPAESLSAAGLTLNQHYLPLVGEGQIHVRQWLSEIEGTTVRFPDDEAEEFDGILFGTGFDLDLPFLSEDIRTTLDLDDTHLDAHLHTFHPDLPGLAILGMWDQSGGYFVPIELQARWVAYTWAGIVPAPSDGELRTAIAVYRSRRALSQRTRMNLIAIELARAAGVEPQLDAWPGLRRALLFGPLAPSCFRLDGPDALPDAAERFARDAAAFGAIVSPALTEREERYAAMIGLT
jgi:dimethylaniline monooxygenase (N-oxide forming)